MGVYQFKTEQPGSQVLRVTLHDRDKPVLFGDVLRDWAIGGSLTEGFTGLIAGAPFPSLFWEMPPLTTNRLDLAYECVLVDARALGRLQTDTQTFAEHYNGPETIAVFDNLGADAVLVAPLPIPTGAQYTHLARFCRSAPPELACRFWQRLGEVALRVMSADPIWISTAGLGVGWLHARLDTRPKYYSYDPYRHWT